MISALLAARELAIGRFRRPTMAFFAVHSAGSGLQKSQFRYSDIRLKAITALGLGGPRREGG
jgi:hypothetical protein